MASEAESAEDPTVVSSTKGSSTKTVQKEGGGEGSDAQAASFAPIEPGKKGEAVGNLEIILDVPMRISVRLGTAKMMIRELLQLGQGSVIELEKLAGEPMEVFIGDKLIARGEVVVVNEKFGVRLTDIVSPIERIKQLQEG